MQISSIWFTEAHACVRIVGISGVSHNQVYRDVFIATDIGFDRRRYYLIYIEAMLR